MVNHPKHLFKKKKKKVSSDLTKKGKRHSDSVTKLALDLNAQKFRSKN